MTEGQFDLAGYCAARLRAAGVGHVPIEIKPLGDYSAAALEDIVERQLLGRYMLPPDRRCGILLLVRRDERKWRLGGKEVEMAVLVEHLRAHGRALGARHGKDIFVAVIDLLATPAKPEPAARARKPSSTKKPAKKKAAAKKAGQRPAKKAARR